MGKPLVRFCEGQEINGDMEEIVWHRRESRRQRKKQTSSCNHGRLLSTRKFWSDGRNEMMMRKLEENQSGFFLV
jgi:hypothetical protein